MVQASGHPLIQRQGVSASKFMNSPELKNYVDRLRLVREVDARQGNLEVITGTVRFTVGVGGVINAGVFRTMFQDKLGEATASGLVQTYADGNLWGGQVPAGVMLLLEGMEVNVESDYDITAQDINIITRAISLLVHLRQTPVYAGSPRDWPSILGARGVGNGNTDNGVVAFVPPIPLKPLESFTARFTVERPITLSLAEDEHFDLHVRFPGVRIYDPMVLGKS